jgi:hypothetical protein
LAFSDVRVIENLPLYAGVDDLDFLKRLDDIELFPDDPSEAGTGGRAGPQELVAATRRDDLTLLFRSYPSARQQQLRNLDQQLHNLDPAARERLSGVLESYAVWCDRLSDADRKEVLTAASPTERLDAVKRVKLRTWRASLPASDQARLDTARDEQELTREVTGLRNGEAGRRARFEFARRQWDELKRQGSPWPFSDESLRGPVEEYAKALRGRLLPWEVASFNWVRDRATQGPATGGTGLDWLVYGATLYDLAHRHPTLPAFATGTRITRVNDLPSAFQKEIQQAASKHGGPRRAFFGMPVGRWPDFAEAVVKEAHDLKVPIGFPIGPAKPEEFSNDLNYFVSHTLKNKLSPNEWDSLLRLRGEWPAYPKKMISLAREHNLSVPGITLPGPPRTWEQLYGPPGG